MPNMEGTRRLTSRMDEHDTEQAIDEELEKLSVNLSDMGSDSDADIEEDFTASNVKLENDLPDSVLAYFKASSNRMNTFEQLILEDLDDLETMCNEMFRPNQHTDLLNELGSNFDEDPLKLKERIMSEIEEQVGPPCETHDSNGDGDDTEYDTHKDSERQFMFEWRRLEERLRKEEEQRLAELKAEREQCLNSAREEEEKKRRRSEQLKEEVMRTEAMNQFEYLKPVAGDGEMSQRLQLEMVEQQTTLADSSSEGADQTIRRTDSGGEASFRGSTAGRREEIQGTVHCRSHEDTGSFQRDSGASLEQKRAD
ncbi:hypothetical protein AMELA_G00039220 [Ameiurus melas]|uniref:Uncharacterized protein n=1 Tax=Ameiurus melas TaxID=219545 RepID=A0A7J6BAZ4_AMEME|nr:hypothetical protein AMELA_G00039220 [Ameiurus melas]